jgi:hypothetical protein
MPKRVALALAMILASSSAGHAEVFIESVHWQLALPTPGAKPVFSDIQTLPSIPPRFVGRLRALVVLKNRGPQAVEGILLRYAIAAKLSPLDGSAASVWAVPYMIDERRVPKIGPNRMIEVGLDTSRSLELPLNLYLQRVFRSGFWPEMLRIQVMLSPHSGAVDAVVTHEKVLEVKKGK